MYRVSLIQLWWILTYQSSKMLAWHIFFLHHVTCVNFNILLSSIIKLTLVRWSPKTICQASILLLRYQTRRTVYKYAIPYYHINSHDWRHHTSFGHINQQIIRNLCVVYPLTRHFKISTMMATKVYWWFFNLTVADWPIRRRKNVKSVV